MTDELKGLLSRQVEDLEPRPGLAAGALSGARREQRHRRVLAGAVVLALVGGGSAVALTAGSPTPDTLVPITTPTQAEPRTGNQALVVRDGDRVAASAHVVQEAGQAAQLFCPGSFRATLVGYRTEPPLTACSYGVALAGFDNASLTNRRERDGAVEGDVSVTGIWRNGTITVDEQGPPQRSLPRGFGVPSTPPCPAPAGGWPRTGDPVEDQANAVEAYREAHPGAILALYVGHPAPPANVFVLLIGSEADRAGVERAFRGPLGDQLCVAVADPSHAQALTAQDEYRRDLQSAGGMSNGIRYDYDAAGVIRGHFVLSGQRIDQAVADFADRYPPDVVVLEPQIRPVP